MNPNPTAAREENSNYLSEIRALVQWLRERGVDPQTAIGLFKAEVLRDELQHARGNQCAMAEHLGMHRNTVARQLKMSGVVPARHWKERQR